MRVAVMSDIHGFDLALETVLEDLTQRGRFDAVIVAGDLCAVGPAPARVLQLLSLTGFTVLEGNTDFDLVNAARTGTVDPESRYALDQIGEAGVNYLAQLPPRRRITPPRSTDPSEDLLVVHANPYDLETKITPEMSDVQIRQIVGDTKAAAIAFGHHHVAFVRQVDDVLLCDVSAVGNPKDGDLRCKYGILHWSDVDRLWRAEIVRIEYPLEATMEEIQQSSLPDREGTIRKLLRASY
jgi:predicted phosphodiesterase